MNISHKAIFEQLILFIPAIVVLDDHSRGKDRLFILHILDLIGMVLNGDWMKCTERNTVLFDSIENVADFFSFSDEESALVPLQNSKSLKETKRMPAGQKYLSREETAQLREEEAVLWSSALC